MNDIKALSALIRNGAKPGSIKYKRVIMFAITARSGSTVITDAVGNMGFAKEVNEIFNQRGPVENLYRRYGGCDLADYINNIYENTMLTDTLVFKTDFRDFKSIIDKFDVDMLFPELKVVYIERRDKVMQAISLYKAVISKNWHQKKGERSSPAILKHKLDVSKVISYMNRIEIECDEWKDFFLRRGIEPINIYYEDFDKDNSILNALYEKIMGIGYSGDVILNYRKLRDSESDEWAEQVKKTLPSSSL